MKFVADNLVDTGSAHRPSMLFMHDHVKANGGSRKGGDLNQDQADIATPLPALTDLRKLRKPITKLASDTVLLHVGMLNDRTRTSAYMDAIRRVVHRGDVVLDIGTGTGICALAAARAGARHVYAIEVGGVARVARSLFAANGFSDRISLVRGWSTEVQLPERADVLVSELIGDEPLAEDVLGVTKDALRRLLKPNARLVPSGIQLFGLPVTVPDDVLNQCTFTPATVQKWQSWYGLEFAPLTKVAPFRQVMDFMNPHAVLGWKTLSAPVLLADVDFKTWQRSRLRTTVPCTATAPGQLNGMIVYFELKAGSNTFFTTHPASTDESNHWCSPVYSFVHPISLETGSQFELTYWYRFDDGLSGCAVRRRD